MKKITFNYLYPFLFIIAIIMVVSSCKKDHSKSDSDNNNNNNNTPKQLSDADSLTYLMYRTMQVSFVDGGRDSSNDVPTYYWYDKVPKLDPLSSDYDSAEVLLNKMKTYAINPSTGNPYDKYSFLDKLGTVADEIQGGVAGDLGMQVTYAGDGTPTNTTLYVLYADKNSPAGKSGVLRGWKITAINGNSVAYDGSNGPNVNGVVNAVYYAASASFTFKKPDGSTQTSTLSKAVYDINPVLFDTVYNVGGKNVGYFVFNTFANVQNNNGPTLTKRELDRVFGKFVSSGIKSLIVDLRYNGGGSVATTEYIDNLIAPMSANGKEMYHYLYNNKMTANVSDLPNKVLFSTTGSLNLDNIFFIGGSGTASASELTINNLKPYMSVKLVGKTTYGKPVGFFTFHLSDFPNGIEKDLADLYAINFETKNANNQGGYFTGLTPDADATDFVNVPWGDNKNDDNLTKIFSYISTGTFPRISAQERMSKDRSLRMNMSVKSIPALRFNGMVSERVSEKMKPIINKRLGRATY
ncbi:MAG: S41 family peptidase [Ginsengibacter sp.]